MGHDEHNYHSYDLMMERMPTYRTLIELDNSIKVLWECEEDIRGTDEAEVEEDLREVKDKSFVTIVECQATTHGSVLSQHSCHVENVLSLTT